MNALRTVGVCLALLAGVASTSPLIAQTEANADEIRLKEAENVVEVSTDGVRWILTKEGAVLKPFEHLRVGPNSRATLQWSDKTVVTFGPRTEIEILPPHASQAVSGVHLLKGLLSFFHRDKPGRIRVITSGAVAGIDGTEFVVEVATVNNVEQTTLSVLDGRVSFSNQLDALTLTNGQQAVATPNTPPMRTAGFIANNVLQWAFYYPAVLDLRDLPLTRDEEAALSESLANYRKGDLLAALASYGQRQPGSDADRVYHAALLLSVGEVRQANEELTKLSNGSERVARLAAALRQLIAAVKREDAAPAARVLSTELLAASYYEQSRATGDASLTNALALAKTAATNSPEFGFAWARVAELEFSFGRTGKAIEALDKSLALSPRNAQALALKGFLLAAQNKPKEAIDWFNRALTVDSALGNAWLGRGLCRIRRGDLREGREDLLIAAALEPRRAQLRSYLGKAYGDSGETTRALHELELARNLDTNDPTAYLYSALVKADHNRINEAIRDLEKSQELNDNRSVYRSSVLLDQDRAVRSVNLARLYADGDLNDVAVREAGRAVSADYGNYSAHLFLANSYEIQRRESLSSHRFEAASFSEYLIANLLGPANGQLLAQPVNQLEYSELFDRNRLGLIANTEYFSRGAWHHSSAQYGTLDGSSYSLEAEYRAEPGERKNQDYEIRQLEGKFKQELTSEDSLYLHIIDSSASGGDTRQLFADTEVVRSYRFEDNQTPTVMAGLHHQWSPQNHTIVLVGRFNDKLETLNPFETIVVLDRPYGTNNALAPVRIDENYRSHVDLYSAELQQIALLGRHSLVAGARGQWTKQTAFERAQNPSGENFPIVGTNNPVSLQRGDIWSSSATIYMYNYLSVVDSLQVIGGVNFTHQSVPVNSASTPITFATDHQERVSPKAGIIWSPAAWSSIRASYSESLTGGGLGQSVRLEPTHVAGLVQTFRDPVPASLAGSLDGVDLTTTELLWEAHLHDSYFSLGGQSLDARRNRSLGLFISSPTYDPPPKLGLIREKVHFREQALDVSFHHLFSEEWSVGATYRIGYAELKRLNPEYPNLGIETVEDHADWEGWLHNLRLSALYRHHSGMFGRVEGLLFIQERQQEHDSVPRDQFWQVNVIAGYRFPRQRAEVAVGVMNLMDDDYRLDPINHYSDLPRGRTFYARVSLNF